MRRSPLLALVLLVLPGSPARADKTFINRCGDPVGLLFAGRSGSLGFVEALVIRAQAPGLEPGRQPQAEPHLFPLNRGLIPGPIRLGDGDSVVFRVRTERHWAPAKCILAVDLFTFNPRRPWDEREFRGEYLRLKFGRLPGSGELLSGERLVPADRSEEDVYHRFRFQTPVERKGDLELVAAAPGWCVIL